MVIGRAKQGARATINQFIIAAITEHFGHQAKRKMRRKISRSIKDREYIIEGRDGVIAI